MSFAHLSTLLAPGMTVREARPGVWSVLPRRDEGAPYDAKAATYDRLVGSALYNRLAWGTSAAHYRALIRKALAAGEGPFLEAGCGSALFTAQAYAATERPVVLVDRSLGMLEVARVRLNEAGADPDRVILLQADLFALPFRPAAFRTVLSMGMLHLFDDAAAFAQVLASQMAPGASLYASSLVSDRGVGRAYLGLLHGAGEVAAPRTSHEVRLALVEHFGAPVEMVREGNMAYFTAGPAEAFVPARAA